VKNNHSISKGLMVQLSICFKNKEIGKKIKKGNITYGFNKTVSKFRDDLKRF
jgi:hypothetical protein